MTLAAALREAVRATGAATDRNGIVVSRAASPEVKAAVAAIAPMREAPVLGGRTVWEAWPQGLACVETPNWWGRRETPPARHGVVVDRRYDDIRPDVARRPDPAWWTSRTQLLAACLRTAGQMRGVVPAHGEPQAPWAVLLLPVGAERVADGCAAAGIAGVMALAPRVPELPGGLRLVAPAGDGSEWCRAVVASISQEIEGTGSA